LSLTKTYEQFDPKTHWTDRILSSSGDWSGNVYDFYFRVYNKIAQDIKVPFKLEGGDRIDDTPVHKALREALANCLINADYYGRQGVVIIKKSDVITLSNPGDFRIEVETAISGGVSDPRNSALIKMFNLIEVGERAGSGIPNIFNVWNKQGWSVPVITEGFDPERITLSLNLGKTSDKKQSIKTSDKKQSIKTSAHKEAIVVYLTNNASAKCAEMSALIGVSIPRTRAILSEMVEDDIIKAEGENKNRIYKLKA
jgi:predicted HTH transcriptional regulator